MFASLAARVVATATARAQRATPPKPSAGETACKTALRASMAMEPYDPLTARPVGGSTKPKD